MKYTYNEINNVQMYNFFFYKKKIQFKAFSLQEFLSENITVGAK